MASKLKTIDDYLMGTTEESRLALEELRKIIKAVAPEAEECITYGLAGFRLKGRALVAFGALAHHCAFYVMSSTTVEAHKVELRGYNTSTGTIRFHPSNPLPAPLVRKLVRARIAENQALLRRRPRALATR